MELFCQTSQKSENEDVDADKLYDNLIIFFVRLVCYCYVVQAVRKFSIRRRLSDARQQMAVVASSLRDGGDGVQARSLRDGRQEGHFSLAHRPGGVQHL